MMSAFPTLMLPSTARSAPGSIRYGRRRTGGAAAFSLIELLVYLGLVSTIAASILPLWSALERRAADSADQTYRLLAARVVAARFERDLRLASVAGSVGVGTALLEATQTECVIVTRSQDGASLELVEWEVTGANLMRRRGVWTGSLPETINHGLYFDHKTMFEGAASGSRFSYVSGAVADAAPVDVSRAGPRDGRPPLSGCRRGEQARARGHPGKVGAVTLRRPAPSSARRERQRAHLGAVLLSRRGRAGVQLGEHGPHWRERHQQ